MAINTSTDVFKFYRYTPSIAACIIFIILFSHTSIFHTYQFVRTKSWIILPLVIGAYSETFSYISRILSSKQSPNYGVALFVMQGTPSLLGPVLFAATVYMCFGRIVRAVDGEHLALIRPSWITLIFVSGDVMGLLIQGAGASIMPLGGLDNFHMGEKFVIAGLALMVASFGLFVAQALLFHRRIRHRPTARSRSVMTLRNWKRDLHALYAASVLIMIRSVFRLVEYSQGNDGYLIAHEWTLYVFDTVLMFAVLVLFNVLHPSHVKAVLDGGRYVEFPGLRIGVVEKGVGVEREREREREGTEEIRLDES